MIKLLISFIFTISLAFSAEGNFKIKKIFGEEQVEFFNGKVVSLYGIDILNSVQSSFVSKYSNRHDKFECEIKSFGESIYLMLNKALIGKEVKVINMKDGESIIFLNGKDVNKEIIKSGLAVSTNHMYKFLDYDSYYTKVGFWKLNPEIMASLKNISLIQQPNNFRDNEVSIAFFDKTYTFQLRTYINFFSLVNLKN